MYRIRGTSQDGTKFSGTLEDGLRFEGELSRYSDADHIVFRRIHTRITERQPAQPPRTRKRVKRR